jgi:homoserine kinase
MLSRDEAIAKKVQTVMQEIYQQIGLEFNTYVTTINQKGVKVIEG